MDKTIKYLVEKKNNNKRLDIFLSAKIDIITRSYIKKLIIDNHVRINKIPINACSAKVRSDDEVLINIEKICPFLRIGDGIPPADESRPFRLNIIFIV